MPTPEDRLRVLGITLPDVPVPLGSYVPAVRTGNLVFISGMLPLVEGKLTRTGKVGGGVSPDEAKEDARVAAVNGLSVLKAALGDLSSVVRCVKLTGFVSSTPDFTGQPGIVNGASDLMAEVFGETGRHAREAVGVPVLPLDSPVEVSFVFEVSE
jgi:enamine deaminase RidA (YjgF/YER057c/UK114 family)